MSDPANRNGAVVTWRAVVSVGLAIIGGLLLFVIDVIKDTSKGVNDVQSKLSAITGDYGAQLRNHENRLNNLEGWRNTGVNR